ncbi:hypothetical protein [Streptomyces sp. NPDC050988]|uniref:hypothetical protein n=1 Tax=Streptomyces sp. NPDC050988 TaxID=3365637 RepID=UPI0037A3581B
MDVVVDSSVTGPSPGGNGWFVTLALSPGTGGGRLDWHPDGLADPETIMIKVGTAPLTDQQVDRIGKVVAGFSGIAVIDRAEWTYLHNQGRWDYIPEDEDDLLGAIEELTYLVRECLE